MKKRAKWNKGGVTEISLSITHSNGAVVRSTVKESELTLDILDATVALVNPMLDAQHASNKGAVPSDPPEPEPITKAQLALNDWMTGWINALNDRVRVLEANAREASGQSTLPMGGGK